MLVVVVGGGGGGGGGCCICWGHCDVSLKWVTFGDPQIPTYEYTFGEMSLELGLMFYHHPYNWGQTAYFQRFW